MPHNQPLSREGGGDDFQTRAAQRSDGGWAVEYRQSDRESWSTAPRRFLSESDARDYAAKLSEEWDG